jgi:hypothetical protein
VLVSAGRDQIAADEDEREQHQDEIKGVHRQRTIMLRPPWSDKRSRLRSDAESRRLDTRCGAGTALRLSIESTLELGVTPWSNNYCQDLHPDPQFPFLPDPNSHFSNSHFPGVAQIA